MGEDITNLNSHKLAQRGLILVPEGRGIFGRLTVKENLDMGAFSRNDSKVIKKDLQNVYNFFQDYLSVKIKMLELFQGANSKW